ncbi:Fc.00g094820.m01.CDS01 [Cosmosporella sp. VM-42]
MADNDVEAKPGDRIDRIALKAESSLPYLPNLVIIHAGTNDCLQNYDAANARLRMGALMDRILSAIKGSTVLISPVIPNLNAEAESCIETVNGNLIKMVNSNRSAGTSVFIVDLHDPDVFTTADLNTQDGTHPTDEGYVKMAKG